MSATQTSPDPVMQSATAAAVALKLEVVVLPVSDVERAKQFYQGLGWRLDADFAYGDDWRLVQMTPPGSPCSIMFGKGFTSAAPGSVHGTMLVVDDVDAARTALNELGAKVSDVFHFENNLLRAVGNEGRLAGLAPQRASYFSFATFSDPDGNSFLLQEVTTRFPGRGVSNFDVPNLTALLRETEEHHGAYEATAPKHHWSDWYAAYMVAREHGKTPEAAADEGAQHMARLRQ